MGLGLEISDQELDEVISNQKANQCCALIYTSGTTGSPKGVMLSHDNVSSYEKKDIYNIVAMLCCRLLTILNYGLL